MSSTDKKMLIRRAEERGCFDHGWLKTCHTFSFADYHNEKWMGFRSLRVINEDRIAPGKGFDLHSHRDMEIVTYVMKGALRHVDSMGNNEVLNAGEVQVMTAGTGVRHMEVNASQTEECHLYQIWVQPDRTGHTPHYAKKEFALRLEKEKRILVSSPDGRDGSLPIHQNAEIWLWRLDAGETATIEVPEVRACWVQVVEGEAELGDQHTETSDAVILDKATNCKASTACVLMVFLV